MDFDKPRVALESLGDLPWSRVGLELDSTILKSPNLQCPPYYPSLVYVEASKRIMLTIDIRSVYEALTHGCRFLLPHFRAAYTHPAAD